MQKNQNIPWKTISVETTSDNGVLLRGELSYWSKDYTVCLKEPFEAQAAGAHLMYSAPAVYITTDTSRTNIVQINLLDRAKDALRCLYRRGAVTPEEIAMNEKDLEVLEQFRIKKRELKHKFKTSLIDQTEYQRCLKLIQIAKIDLELKISKVNQNWAQDC